MQDRFLVRWAGALAGVLFLSLPSESSELTTSFEFLDLSGAFTLGTSPLTATFTNGQAKSIMAFSLYKTGTNSWMVDSGDTGTVTFGSPPSRVQFCFRDQDPTVQSTLTVRDPMGGVLFSAGGTSAGFTPVDVSGPIGSVELQNNSGQADRYTVIDDMIVTFTETTTYCTAKVNSQGCVPQIATSGSAAPSLTSPQAFDVDASSVLNNKPGLYFYGTQGKANIPFLNATLCMNPPLRRTPVQLSGGNPPPDDCSGTYTFDFQGWLQSGADPNLTVGTVVTGQFWSRDPAIDATGSNLTNAAEYAICP